MTSEGLARSYLKRARARRKALDTLLDAQVFADVVRGAQEVHELVLKAALRFVGLDPPKRHDVGAAIRRALPRFPADLQEEFLGLVESDARLARERSRAFYGDEDALVDASELFGPDDAATALGDVDRALGACARLLGEP